MWYAFFSNIKALLICVFFLKDCRKVRYKLNTNIKKILLFFKHSQLVLLKLWGVFFYRLSIFLQSKLSATATQFYLIWCKISKIITRKPYRWQYLTSKSNFLLAIRPKPWQFFKNKSVPSVHFPPPGYGIPSGYENLVPPTSYHPQREYALYLLPGKLSLLFIVFALILPWFIFSPLKGDEGGDMYLMMVCIYIAASFALYYFLFVKIMPESLSNVWKKWPIPAYELFLSVPHSIYISRSDRYDKDKTKKGIAQYKKIKQSIFWRPDVKSPMWRQSTEYSPNMQTLQELVLNLALFELLFHKKTNDDKNNEQEFNQNDAFSSLKTLHEMRWYLYLFAPIWVNLFLILSSLVFFISIKATLCDASEWHLIANFPYNFISVISLWYIFTVLYSIYILNYLNELSEKLRKGIFRDKLHLIPPQILDELSYIPSHREVEAAMHHLRRALAWISSVVFVALMSILEVLSQAFGNQSAIFNF